MTFGLVPQNVKQNSILQDLLFTSYKVYFKKSFTTLKAYINLFRGYVQCFELSQCSKTHQLLPGIVMVQCDFHW
jgi:hypothetical protein